MIQALAFQPGLRLQGITILLKLAVILYASSHSSGRSLCNSSFGVVHDYRNPALPGSAKAVNEFMNTHPEYQMRLAGTLAILRRPEE